MWELGIKELKHKVRPALNMNIGDNRIKLTLAILKGIETVVFTSS